MSESNDMEFLFWVCVLTASIMFLILLRSLGAWLAVRKRIARNEAERKNLEAIAGVLRDNAAFFSKLGRSRTDR